MPRPTVAWIERLATRERRQGARDFVHGRRLILATGTSMRTNREFGTIALELTTEGNRVYRDCVTRAQRTPSTESPAQRCSKNIERCSWLPVGRSAPHQLCTWTPPVCLVSSGLLPSELGGGFQPSLVRIERMHPIGWV